MKIKNMIMLLLTALIWGTAFTAQSVGMDYIGPFTFTSVRSLMGGIVLLPVICLFDKTNGKKQDGAKADKAAGWKNRDLLCGGVLCGLALCTASNLQQIGIQYTTVGKAGFITALYIVLVPICGFFFGKRAGLKLWVSVVIAAAGLYLLCITEKFTIGKGDFLVLLCAAVFTFHIMLIDHYSPLVDGVKMSCIQFFVTGILSAVPMLLFEKPSLSQMIAAAAPLLYAGVLSSGVGYTLQIVAQKGIDPTVASLILSMESVFSVLSGWLILGQSLKVREISGCVLMFTAILLAQLPEKTQKVKKA